MSAPAPVKVAVIGMGMSTTVFHVPFILSLPKKFTLAAIVERSATPEASKARDRYGSSITVVNTLDQAITSIPDLSAVWICSVNDTHYDYAKQALLAGKHVIVEKPVTPTSVQAEELAKLARDKNLVLAVYQNRRWDADYLTVKKLIKEGKLGELSEFTSHFDRYKNVPNAKAWKEAPIPGTGATYDLGSHLIDQILDLFGPPKSVTGFVRNSRLIGHPEVPDSFVVHLHYPPAPSDPSRSLPLLAIARGSILSLQTPQSRFTVKGTRGTFVKYGLDAQEAQLIKDGEKAIGMDGFARDEEDLWGTLWALEEETGKAGKAQAIPSERGNYRAWFENVGTALQANDPSLLIVKPEQAALTIRIIELAELSSKEGRTIEL
ncbi:hypothetical protein JCM10908_001964 [Rhodotorula pacifica]|uniref:uncharacterized protein n=1 Tax=Rhodotorula pacifica TaxID=1495444 RepID=UPI00316EB28E